MYGYNVNSITAEEQSFKSHKLLKKKCPLSSTKCFIVPDMWKMVIILNHRISVIRLFKSLEKIWIHGSTPTGCMYLLSWWSQTKNQRLLDCSNWTRRIGRCPTSDTVLLSQKGTVLLIVNLQFSDFLQFGNLAIWSHLEPFGEWYHNPYWPVVFIGKFEQTKIGDLCAIPEIWKSRKIEILSSKQTEWMKL